jgi:hypothetical protein
MVFNATFNNTWVISWWSALLVEETGVPGENHPPVASQWVSEWMFFTANPAIFQLYHDENKLIFNEMMMKFALY